mmetsp:Transcript_60613/g.195250  ORF Transcript_60613/g.195250 Transcript_60613/m.195250 type:complete len:226 (-) Transcript_60613:447-1124(-)
MQRFRRRRWRMTAAGDRCCFHGRSLCCPTGAAPIRPPRPVGPRSTAPRVGHHAPSVAANAQPLRVAPPRSTRRAQPQARRQWARVGPPRPLAALVCGCHQRRAPGWAASSAAPWPPTVLARGLRPQRARVALSRPASLVPRPRPEPRRQALVRPHSTACMRRLWAPRRHPCLQPDPCDCKPQSGRNRLSVSGPAAGSQCQSCPRPTPSHCRGWPCCSRRYQPRLD